MIKYNFIYNKKNIFKRCNLNDLMKWLFEVAFVIFMIFFLSIFSFFFDFSVWVFQKKVPAASEGG